MAMRVKTASCLMAVLGLALAGCKSEATEVPATQDESAPLAFEAGIAALDDTAINYGYGSKDRDEKNRPNSCLEYEEKYSQLSAHFIGSDENVIYLTFDEGYENGYTSGILDILKEKGVQAVFFVTGHYVSSNPELVRRMIDEGHAVGNHSYSHPSGGLPSLSDDEIIADTKKLENLLLENFGYKCTLYRFPAGIFSESAMQTIKNLGYTSLFWSFAYQDWLTDDQPDEAEALEKMTQQLHPGAIYLLHSVSSANAHVLGDFIDNAVLAGYEIKIWEQ